MAIVFKCPECDFPYRLKDELAGKKATCKNPDCRKQILIPAPSSNGLRISDLGGIMPENADKNDTPLPTNPADLEATALAALRDTAKEQEDTAADQAIPMVCPHCNHKWTEPYSKAGKNTLCPNEECRQRVKVTPPKKGDVPQDWRSGASNKPTLAKENFEKPADVMDAEARVVGKDAWQKGGGAEQDLEPVTLKRRLFIYSLIAAPILLLGIGIYFLVTWRSSRGEEIKMDPALKEFADAREELAPAQAALFSAILELAAGEHAIHPQSMEKDKALKLAHSHFTKARTELQQAAQKDPKNAAERYAVTGELALALLGLGGNDEQVKEGSRFRWIPDPPSNRPLRVNERIHTVHEELQRTLGPMMEADFDTKAALARRMARELGKQGQFELASGFTGFLFKDPELPEAKAIVALELYRLNRGSEFPKSAAEELKAILAGGAVGRNPAPASAQMLWNVVGTEKAPTLFGPPTGTQPQEPNRYAYVGISILKDDPAKSLELAKLQSGTIAGQLRALVLYAEWAPDPGPAFDSALSAISLNSKAKKEPPPPALVMRLSQLAASTGRRDQAKQLADLVTEEGQKVWAKGSAIQFAATPSNKNRVEDAELELPSDAKQLRAGHAWGKFWQARQNARHASASDVTKSIVGWPKGTIHPFGLAGIAVAQHEK